MAYSYLIKYELVLDGRQLNERAPKLIEKRGDVLLPFE